MQQRTTFNAFCYNTGCVVRKKGLVNPVSKKYGTGRIMKIHQKKNPGKIIDCPDCGHASFWERDGKKEEENNEDTRH